MQKFEAHLQILSIYLFGDLRVIITRPDFERTEVHI